LIRHVAGDTSRDHPPRLPTPDHETTVTARLRLLASAPVVEAWLELQRVKDELLLALSVSCRTVDDEIDEGVPMISMEDHEVVDVLGSIKQFRDVVRADWRRGKRPGRHDGSRSAVGVKPAYPILPTQPAPQTKIMTKYY
jgi:hypothetical protein